MHTPLGRAHREQLAKWRRQMNLVGPGDLEEHFLDCHAALAPLKQPAGRWVDLGSGAGFPGLVLADKFPALVVDLSETRKKRCWFLEQVLVVGQVPPAQVRVKNGRVEELETGAYDGVMSRAFAPPPEVLEHASRLLKTGGQVVLFLQEDAEPPAADGFELFHVEHYTVCGRRRKSAWYRKL